MIKACRRAWFVIAFVVLLFAPGQTLGQHPSPDHQSSPGGMPDPGSLGPRDFKVEFENDAVLVLRIRLRPREKTPMHDLSARVVVWLTNAHLRDAFPDGRSEEVERTMGAVDWVPAQRHAGENLGDAPIEFLAIVPKASSSGHPN